MSGKVEGGRLVELDVQPPERRADVVVAASPVYRATYSGLLKVFFDLLPRDALAGRIGVPILTGAGPAHRLALEHGFGPLFASVGAAVVAHGVYGWDAQFTPAPEPALAALVDRAIEEAVALALTMVGR